MGTAPTFRDRATGTATTAGTLDPAEVALQVHCNHCRITASTACSQHPHSGTMQGALQPLQGHSALKKWPWRCTAMTAGPLHSPSWARNPASQHTAFTLWDTECTAWALHPHSGTMQGALQPLQDHCIHLHGHCILRHNILHPPCLKMLQQHGHCIHIQGQCRGHCNNYRDNTSS